MARSTLPALRDFFSRISRRASSGALGWAVTAPCLEPPVDSAPAEPSELVGDLGEDAERLTQVGRRR